MASATAAVSTAEKAPEPPPPPPEPLNVAELEKALKCSGQEFGPCQVLAQFQNCIDWSPITDSGDGRWLGKGQVVKKGAFTEELSILRSRRVPTSEVGPGQLGAKIALERIPDDRATEQAAATKALKAYARGDVPGPNSGTDYVKERTEWSEAFSMKAKDNQIYAASGGGLWLCQHDDQRLIMVKLSSSREHKADGTYAIMYAVTW